VVTNRDVFDAGRFGIELAAALQHLYPGKIAFSANRRLIGSTMMVDALAKGVAPADLLKIEKDNMARFRLVREKYLLYRQ